MKKPIDTSWNRVASWYGKEVGAKGHYHHQHSLLPEIVGLIPKGARLLLDLACGQGVLERQIDPGMSYTGVDIAPGLINQAKSSAKQKRSRFFVGDASKPLVFLNASEHFDVITCVLALQNIENYKGFFDNIQSFLAPRGTLILAINHPYYRIPRFSGWEVESGNGRQKRWVSHYLSEQKIPIDMHPGTKQQKSTTWSFHVPLASYVDQMSRCGLAITMLREIASDKQSEGRYAKRENTARAEIPLFMILSAQKIN